MKPTDRDNWLVLSLFFCSGATALVYEVIWSKYLAQMFGSTIYAQTVVLAVFMGGLALGNRLFGGKADRLARPIRAYGLIEFVIGVYAFFFTYIFAAADALFVTAGSAVLENTALLLMVKGALSVLLLLVPTVLMGGTLPLLAAFLQRSSVDPGRRSARFYSINSLGAVFGAAIAGFYLVQNWGMVASLQITGMVNLCIAAAAMALSRNMEAQFQPVGGGTSCATTKVEPSTSPALRWAGLMVALTGGVSMGLEVVAARSMALLFGSSLQCFAIVLISFILGIGLGSALISSPRFSASNHPRAVPFLLLSAALWVGLLVFNIESWVDVYRVLRSGIARSSTGYLFHQLLSCAIAMVVLGIPAAMIGAVVPLLIRRSAAAGATLGSQVGRLLTWNTVGAVGGVLITGFVIMPTAGLRNAFLVLALGLAIAALIASWTQQARRFMAVAGSICALLLVFMAVGNDSWRHVMSSGVFRARETEVSFDAMDARKKHVKILFYQDAPDATVNVEQGDGIRSPADLSLRLNGKTDASTRGDLATQLLLAHVPTLAARAVDDVFILGLGSGVTAGAMLGHPVKHLAIAENCEPIIQASKFFEPWNRGVLTNPVARIWREDARTVLKLSPRKYDVIITQPSNPWTAGVGSVFSHEFYELAASRLKEGGVVAQWFHIYEMHDGIVHLVLRTFGSVFPHMEIWDAGSGDLILLGAKQPWESNPAAYAKIFDRPAVLADLNRVGIQTAETLWARQLASQQTAWAIPPDGPVQSDRFPILEYAAPRAFFIGAKSKSLFKYDERTWQAALSPAAKRNALREMDGSLIQATFREYSPINEEIRDHLLWRFNQGIGSSPEFRPIWPCVFKKQGAEAAAIVAGVSAEVSNLMTAATAIESEVGNQMTAVDQILTLIRGYGPASDWSMPHYASLAIKASMAGGDIHKAREILALAVQRNPKNEELGFLERLLTRESTASRVTQLSSSR